MPLMAISLPAKAGSLLATVSMGLFARLFKKRTSLANPEKRTSLANPEKWLIEYFTGGRAVSGVSVDEQTALKYSVVFACVRVLSETIATLPLIVYRRLEPRGKERAVNHPLYELLHRQPNSEMDATTFREALQAHVTLWGNAYAYISWDSAGRPRELWPLLPDRTWPERTREKKQLYYVTILPDGQRRVFLPRNVLHIRGLSFNGLQGYSVIGFAREAIGLGLAAEEFGARFFSQGTNIGAVVTHPGSLSDKAYERLKTSLKEKYEGLGKSHMLMLLEEGLKFEKLGIPPSDAQFLELRQFQVEDICRWFRMQPHKVQHLHRSTFCLPADVEVLTEHGPKRIADVNAGEKVWSLAKNGRWVLAPVVRSQCTGVDEVLTIRTTNRTLRANAKHRILARRKRLVKAKGERKIGGIYHEGELCNVVWSTEWIPAGELQVGDTIVAAHGLPSGGTRQAPTRKATIGFMEFLGLYIGDGNMTNNHVAIARGNSAPHMGHYRKVMLQEFKRCNGATVTLCEADRRTLFSSIDVVKELRELGFSGTAHTKSVPGWIFTLSSDLKLAFLRGFLDADGSVDKKGRISFSSCNRVLLSQMRHLCISLGIPVTNLRCQEGETTLPNGKRTKLKQWVFTCSDPGANQRIGSHTPKYVERFNKGKPFNRKKRAYPRYGGRNFELEGCELSRITSIERQAIAEPVYDLEVENTHSFIADGVVVHNSNIEHQAIEHVVDTIRPWCVRWEQAINTKLLMPNERREYFAEFLIEGLLRGDTESRYKAYATARQWGWLSANDVRELENMNPIPGGDTYLIPMNMVPADSAADSAPAGLIEQRKDKEGGRSERAVLDFAEQRAQKAAVSRQKLAHSFRRLFADAGARIVKREVNDLRRALKKLMRQRDAQQFKDWLEEYYREHPEFIAQQMLPVLMSYAEAVGAAVADEIGTEAKMTPELEEFIKAYEQTFATRYVISSKRQLLQLLREAQDAAEDPVPVIEERLDGWVESRPQKIAMRESNQANNAVALAIYASAGILRKRWVAIGKSCPYCMSLNGKTISIASDFIQAGEEFKPAGADVPLIPRSRVGNPPAHPGCDCYIVSGV